MVAGDIPSTEHWVILRFGTEMVPFNNAPPHYKDEVRVIPTSEYWAFTDIEEWSEGIRELVCSGDIAFTAFRANPAKISLSVSVE